MSPAKKQSASHSKQADRSIGAVIKAARRTKGLSQEELAHFLGYDSGQFVSDWERGLSAIPMKRLAEIANILDLNHAQLFELLLEFSVERLSESMRKEFEQQTVRKRSKKK